MSLVVRHKDTGQYLQAHGCWTSQLECAMQFNSGLRLVDYVEHDGGVHEKAEQIEIVVLDGMSLNEPVVKGPNLFS
jgi:hypothetical protein